MTERISTPPRTFDAFFASPDQDETVDNLYSLCVELEEELLASKLKIKDFCIEFEKTSWGWDGDCGTQCLVEELEETVQDKFGEWTY